MSFKAEVVGDSINEYGNRITTMVVTFPRIILAEFNTHRMFSRNSASSRAIPFEKMLKSVEENPFIPIAWQKNHKGMQGTEYFTDPNDIKRERLDWLDDRAYAITKAKRRAERGVTKQIVNRPLEPFMWHTVIVTATDWENFFALRCPQYQINVGNNHQKVFRSRKDLLQTLKEEEAKPFPEYSELDWLKLNKGQAEIHMMKLAEIMWDAYNESVPEPLQPGEWHIPFKKKINYNQLQLEVLDDWNKRGDSPAFDSKFPDAYTEATVKISTFMAARTSYTVVGDDL
jgi:hypothetical protein